MNLTKKQIMDKILSLKMLPSSIKTKLTIQKLQQKLSSLDAKNTIKKD